MSMIRKIFVSVVLSVLCAINVFAGCSGVNFKRTKVDQLSTPIRSVVHLDIDGDGHKDLIGWHPQNSQIVVFYKGSANGFNTAPVLSPNMVGHIPMLYERAFVDFNGDGKKDMIGHTWTAPYSMAIYLNDGNGAFNVSTVTAIQGIPGESAELVVGAGDLNGDGRPDALTRTYSNNNLYYRVLDAQNKFGAAVPLGINGVNSSIRDVNLDGHNDIVAVSGFSTNYQLMTLINNGSGQFETVGIQPVDSRMFYQDNFQYADLNGDGKQEAISEIYQNFQTDQYYFSIYQFSPTGSINQTVVELTSTLSHLADNSAYYFYPRVGDFDGDGDIDVMHLGGSVNVLAKNNGGLNFTSQLTSPPGDFQPHVGDVNSDGKADFISIGNSAIDPSVVNIRYRQNVCQRPGQTKTVDFNGDGVTDLGVWASSGVWNFTNTQISGVNWGSGATGDIPVPQDYDGDGFTDYAVFRESTGYWYIYNSGSGLVYITPFGQPGDKPVPSDFDGDGKADVAIFRPGTGDWYGLPSATPGTFFGVNWGMTGDVPLPADYDADGRSDLAIFRPANNSWYVLKTTGGYQVDYFGTANATPVIADFDDDGFADRAMVTDSTASFWSILTKRNIHGLQTGKTGDKYFARFAGDGFARQTAFRPTNGRFYTYFDDGGTAVPGYSGNGRLISNILPVQ